MLRKNIVAIRFAHGQPPAHEHIAAVKLDNGQWTPVATIIESIRSGWFAYWTLNFRTNQSAKVEIFEDRYIRTAANATWSDNLLALPQG